MDDDVGDDPLNQTVDTVDNPVTDNGTAGGDGVEWEEQLPPSSGHWRGMVLDSVTNTFHYADSDDPEAQNDIPGADQYKKIRPGDPKRVRVSFGKPLCQSSRRRTRHHETLEAKGILPRTIDRVYERHLEITAACYRHYQGY